METFKMSNSFLLLVLQQLKGSLPRSRKIMLKNARIFKTLNFGHFDCVVWTFIFWQSLVCLFDFVLLNCLSFIIFFYDFQLILMPKILIKKMIRIGLFQRLTLCYLEKKVEQREMGIGTLVVSVLCTTNIKSTHI